MKETFIKGLLCVSVFLVIMQFVFMRSIFSVAYEEMEKRLEVIETKERDPTNYSLSCFDSSGDNVLGRKKSDGVYMFYGDKIKTCIIKRK